MVVIRRITAPAKPDSSKPVNNYDLAPIYFELPTQNPTTKPINARPYAFDVDGKPTEYASACAHCGAGNFLKVGESLTAVGDKLFAGCTECRVGMTESIPDMVDPFQNPIKDGKISADELDPGTIKSPIDTTITVADKLKAAASKAEAGTGGISDAPSGVIDKQQGIEQQEEDEQDENEEDALTTPDHEVEDLMHMLDQKNDEI